MDAPSATELNESSLFRWLIAESAARHILPEEFRLVDGSSILFEVPTRDLSPGADYPGDVDILIIPPGAPAQSVAFECKRIKVTSGSFQTGLPGKLAALKRGVHQVNALLQLGFSRTYLLIAIVTDAREQPGGYWWSGPTPELIKMIDGFPGRDRLDQRAGLSFVEITQPVDREIQMSGHIGVRVEHEPALLQQSSTLTEAIEAVLRKATGSQD